MALLQVENLTFGYPDAEQPTLRDMSFSVKEGEFVVICGVSGSGKSTLLRLLKKELAPFGEKNGKILYNGCVQEECDAGELCAQIGFVQQNPENAIVTDKVWHELAFGLESLGFSSAVIRRRVAEMASYFGIEGWFHKDTSELSGGQKQLLNLAGVMVMQPKILLLDEPTAQLDPIAAADFLSTLRRLNYDMGITVIIAEHRLEEVLPISDRVILTDNGEISFNGRPAEFAEYFKDRSSHPMASALPAAARIFASLGESGESPLTVRRGRAFISDNYGNAIRSLPNKEVLRGNETVISLKGICFRYEKKAPDILKNLSIDIFKGERLFMLGGNGAGKTTLLGIMAGTLKPYAGTVKINGKRLGAYSETELYHRNIAMLPQDPQTVFLQNSVREDLKEAAIAMEHNAYEAERLIADTTESLGIYKLLDRHPYDLSGGEQQRAALAKLLLLKPKILLLDEPTKGIDAYCKKQLAEILNSLKKSGVTVIAVTHDIEFAAAYADRCALLFDGEIISADIPAEFFSENTFYTTAANRISKGLFDNAILCEDIVELCRINGKRTAQDG